MMIDMMHFDTLRYTDILVASGFSEEQARGLSKAQKEVLFTSLDKAFPDDLATKADIANVRKDINKLELDMTEVKANITDLKSDVRLLKWMSGFSATGIMAIIAGMIIMILEHSI